MNEISFVDPYIVESKHGIDLDSDKDILSLSPGDELPFLSKKEHIFTGRDENDLRMVAPVVEETEEVPESYDIDLCPPPVIPEECKGSNSVVNDKLLVCPADLSLSSNIMYRYKPASFTLSIPVNWRETHGIPYSDVINACMYPKVCSLDNPDQGLLFIFLIHSKYFYLTN